MDMKLRTVMMTAALWAMAAPGSLSVEAGLAGWQVGTPIVTYWNGPALTDATARQMKAGGFNLVWCDEKGLGVAHRHRLRVQLTDGLLAPASLDNPEKRQALDALITRVRRHPALFDYFITDEPSAGQFAGLGRLIAYLRERDPAHLAYINLFPTYANNQQLGTSGDTVPAYREYLRRFVAEVQPALLSWDHYQFAVGRDTPDYFLNLAMIRQAAQQAGVPFLNIVQACTWTRVRRVPNPDELRYLVYTTLAYGAQGISYFVYQSGGELRGGFADPSGQPTPLYFAVKPLNRDFVAIATQLQRFRSLGVYHAGMLPPGAVPLPADCPFQFDPPVAPAEFKGSEPARGLLLGCFGRAARPGRESVPTHALVVNLDYRLPVTVGLRGPRRLQRFDAATRRWTSVGGRRAELDLPPGGGVLVRIRR
ncbi:MAG: hypothetical protein KGS61_08890 [Verrucomicrobia bacterium]|nr:hypothetical protein [Verrucomicrobiota bacterium]